MAESSGELDDAIVARDHPVGVADGQPLGGGGVDAADEVGLEGAQSHQRSRSEALQEALEGHVARPRQIRAEFAIIQVALPNP